MSNEWIDPKRRELLEWLGDPGRRLGIDRAVAAYTAAKEVALERLPEMEAMRKEVRRIKEESICRMDELVRQTVDSIADVKGTPYLARDAAEARRIFCSIVGAGNW